MAFNKKRKADHKPREEDEEEEHVVDNNDSASEHDEEGDDAQPDENHEDENDDGEDENLESGEGEEQDSGDDNGDNNEEEKQHDDDEQQKQEQNASESNNDNDNNNNSKPAVERPLDTKAIKEKNSKKGIIYLSRIPYCMNHMETRQYFSQFGEVTNVYLALQRGQKLRKDNLIRHYSEGWVEFARKAIAKRVALSLNGTQFGGRNKKRKDFIWNISYMRGLKWEELAHMRDRERDRELMRMIEAQAKKEQKQNETYKKYVAEAKKKRNQKKRQIWNQFHQKKAVDTKSLTLEQKETLDDREMKKLFQRKKKAKKMRQEAAAAAEQQTAKSSSSNNDNNED